MNRITKRLEQALDTVRTMTPDQQDLLAIELIERAQAFKRAPTRLTTGERAEPDAELAAARRGEPATDDVAREVRILRVRHTSRVPERHLD